METDNSHLQAPSGVKNSSAGNPAAVSVLPPIQTRGVPFPPAGFKPLLCGAPGCGNPHYAHGYCEKHAKRLARTGTIEDAPITKIRARNEVLFPLGQHVCTGCNQEKPLSEFGKATRGKFGVTDYCKSCLASERQSPRYKAQVRKSALKLNYKITPEKWDEIYKRQGGKCYFGCEPDGELLETDHNHLTGEVRGLLCGACNRALGLLKVDTRPDSGRKLDEYLKAARN